MKVSLVPTVRALLMLCYNLDAFVLVKMMDFGASSDGPAASAAAAARQVSCLLHESKPSSFYDPISTAFVFIMSVLANKRRTICFDRGRGKFKYFDVPNPIRPRNGK